MQLRIHRPQIPDRRSSAREAGAYRPWCRRGRRCEGHARVRRAERHCPRLRPDAWGARSGKDSAGVTDVRRALHLVPKEDVGFLFGMTPGARDFALILAARLLRAFGFGMAA